MGSNENWGVYIRNMHGGGILTCRGHTALLSPSLGKVYSPGRAHSSASENQPCDKAACAPLRCHVSVACL
ncbi:hypothetical protein XELAEV_18001663mg [Xenopus laevis]|uniref:Uncharacterized protein n=1 Tax=Xenopus laevis TaxID=8355 RepID=A0A974BP03_XENLA|nr:hypothetical protein XELAEV_18001663mg [Xenopus laevis]